MNKNANNSYYFIIEISCRKSLTFYNNTSWSWKKLEELIANAELSILLHNFRLASCLATNIKLQTLNFSSYENLSIGSQASKPRSRARKIVFLSRKFTWESSKVHNT